MSLESIYVLIDPHGEIRYVGVTSNPRKRMSAHLSDYGRTHKAKWIRLLKRDGMAPRMTVIQQVPTSVREDAERYWVAYFRASGCRLTNSTDGGDGTNGYQWTDEARAKASASHKTSEKARAAYLRNSSDPEFGRKISAAKLGKPGRKGWHHSKESRSRLSELAKSRPPVSDETRRKLSMTGRGNKSRTGQKQKPEEIAKRYRPVVDQHGVQYASLSDAARKLGLNVANVQHVASGKARSAGGYVFSYLTERRNANVS